MATPVENLDSAIQLLTDELAANPTAVSYSIDGQSVNYSEAVEKLKKMIEVRSMLQGPVEVVSYGVL